MRAGWIRIAMLTVWVGEASAVTPGDLDGVAQRLPAIVVAARRPQPAADVVGTATAIERRAIEQGQAQDIRDLVRYEPGVSVVSDSGRFGLEGFNIRGVQGNRVAIRIDGVPLPDAFAVGSFANAGRDQIDPEWIETLEILRGPASALYGSDALGGIVAIETRRPDDLTAGGMVRELRVAANGRDQGLRLSALGAWQGETQGWLLGVSDRRSREVDNRPEAGVPAANPAAFRRRSALAKWTADVDSVELGLSAERFQLDANVDVRSLVNGPGQFSTTDSLSADDSDSRERTLASVRWTETPDWLQDVLLQAFWQRSETQQSTRQQRRAAPPAQRFPTLRERRFDLAQRQHGLQLSARSTSRGASIEQHWVYGLELSRTAIDERRDGLETNLATGASTSVILGERFPVRDFPNSRLTRQAVFLAGELRGIDSPLSFLVGARWDAYSVDARSDALFAEDFPDLPVVDSSQRRVTPKLGLRFAPNDRHRLWFARSEGFRAPPFSDLNIGLVLPQFNYIVLPNPALKPERSSGLEVGWHYQRDQTTIRLSAFSNRYRNLIESRANLGSNAAGATVFQSVNRARARIRGIEGGVAWRPGWGGSDRWSLDAAFSWTQGDDTARDQPLNTIQPASLTLGLSRREHAQSPLLYAQLTAVAPAWRVDRSAADLFAPPGHALLDIGLRQPLGDHLMVDVGIYNFANKRYWEWSALRGVTRNNLPAPSFYTGPGRHLALTISASF